MAENIENLILEYLSAIRGNIASLSNGVDTLTLRVHSLEDHILGMRKDLA